MNVKFKFNRLISWDKFNFWDERNRKATVATVWIMDLCFNSSEVVRWIFIDLNKKSNETKLDYLQVLSIDWTEVWCIDDWNVITLLTKEEY